MQITYKIKYIQAGYQVQICCPKTLYDWHQTIYQPSKAEGSVTSVVIDVNSRPIRVSSELLNDTFDQISA